MVFFQKQGERRPVPDGKGDPWGSARQGDRYRNGERGDHRPVGTQVSGTVKEIFVDFNSPVKKGQLLAQIDPELSQARVAQARANLLSAEAGVEKAAAALQDAKRTLERNRTLWDRNYIARSDLDTSETSQQSAAAQLSVPRLRWDRHGRRSSRKRPTLQLHPYPLTGGRCGHLPECGCRPDRGRKLPDADSLQHRPGSDPHADRYERGRGGHRPDQVSARRSSLPLTPIPDSTFSGKGR